MFKYACKRDAASEPEWPETETDTAAAASIPIIDALFFLFNSIHKISILPLTERIPNLCCDTKIVYSPFLLHRALARIFCSISLCVGTVEIGSHHHRWYSCCIQVQNAKFCEQFLCCVCCPIAVARCYYYYCCSCCCCCYSWQQEINTRAHCAYIEHRNKENHRMRREWTDLTVHRNSIHWVECQTSSSSKKNRHIIFNIGSIRFD